MKQFIEGFANQVKEAVQIGKSAALASTTKDFNKIIISGMGGSGIGGNIVQSLVEDELTIPIFINKSYKLPLFADADTLVIISSFSGNTEETISVLQQAEATDATIVCITSGGKILDTARKNGHNYIVIPDSIKSPRACLGYSFIQLMYVLKHYRLIDDTFEQEIADSVDLLLSEKDDIKDLAEFIAGKLHKKLPILYSDTRLNAICVRAQQQINENGKHFCHVNVFPEMNHNELVGWVYPESILENSAVILVKSSFDDSRITKRMDICTSIFNEHCATVLEVVPKGDSFMEQCMYLIHLFDWVSVYLADLNEVDPTPVKVIDYLKESLAKK